MDLQPTEQQQAFRRQARSWLQDNVPAQRLPSLDTEEGFAAHRAWEQRLHAAGWSVVHWPQRYGGRDADLTSWLLFEEEYYRAGAPLRVNQNGIFMMGPTLLEFGTAEQRARWLPPMAAGDEIWCQGWSEPEVGSDLAAISAKARRAEDGYLVSGQKIWVSRGVWADWMFGLFRTGSDDSRHRGLTFLALPMNAPGVTVRPIRQLDGEAGFAEVFLDDVKVPFDQRIGQENDGWKVAMATAGFERGVLLRSPGRFVAAAQRLVDLYRSGEPDEVLRDAVVGSWMDAEVHRLHTHWTVSRVERGHTIGAEASLNKLFWSQMDVALHETALQLLDARGPLERSASEAVDEGRWLDGYLFSLAGPIYAGTNQIQRTIVADRVLNLPRAPR